MRRDKKVQQSHIRLVLLQDIEAPVAYTVEVEDRLIDIWKQTIDMFS
jgi:3-dehydroquinate synthetase